jgi:hypothetical protein
MTKKCSQSNLPNPNALRELTSDVSAFVYHFHRLFRTMRSDLRCAARKPAVGNRRHIVPLTPHQETYYRHLQTRKASGKLG